jgi:hypothetical protein
MPRFAITAIFLVLSAGSALACRSLPPQGDIDAALVDSQARLSPADIAKVQALREQATQFKKDGKYEEARHANYQAMHLMGMTFVSNGPPTRNCGGGGQWLRSDPESVTGTKSNSASARELAQ